MVFRSEIAKKELCSFHCNTKNFALGKYEGKESMNTVDTFESLVAKKEIYNESSNCWYIEEYGIMNNEGWLKTIYYREQPTLTKLSLEENIIKESSMMFMANVPEFLRYLRSGCEITDDLFDKYIALDDSWYVNCNQRSAALSYEYRCPSCGKTIKVKMPKSGAMQPIGSGLVGCDVCKNVPPFNVYAIMGDKYNAISIRTEMCGAYTTCDEFRLYPMADDENDNDRIERLKSIATELTADCACSDKAILDKVTDTVLQKNQGLIHVIPNLVNALCNAENDSDKERIYALIDAIDYRTKGSVILSSLGVQVRYSAATVHW